MGCHSSKEAAVEPAPPQQYRWYCCEDGERAEYADDVRDMLEAAYAAYKSGRGATFPTVAVGGDCEVHLTTMQQAHTRTGIKRSVVRESSGPDRAARWYWCAGGELKYRWYWSAGDERNEYADDVRDRLEAAYAEFKDPEGRGATFPTVAVSCDYEVHLKTMQQVHTRTGMKQDVVRELESDVRTPYAADVRHRLEVAYAEFKEGRGPSFPTVDVGGGCTVQLKTMQHRHTRTGAQRDVVREIESHVPKALPPPAAAPPRPVAAPPPPAAVPPPPVAPLSREASCRKVQAAERGRAARKAGMCAAMAAARLQASERGRLVRTKRAAVTAHILAAARLLEDQNDTVSVHVEPIAEAALDEHTAASGPAEPSVEPMPEPATASEPADKHFGLRSGAGERSPAKRGGRLPGFNRAESVRVAEAELRKARDAIKTIPHAPISRALRRLIDEKEAEFTAAARVRRAFEIWAFAACNNFLRWVREARRRQVVVVRVLTRLIKRKLANVFETWCVGLAKRSWLSRSTTTAPDFAASLAATPARSRSRSRRPRSAAAAAATPHDPLRQPSWDFSPTPLDRVVRRTTPAAPYVPAVPKDLTTNPLGGSVRVTTSVRSVSPQRRRSPSPTAKLRSPSLSTVITLTTLQRSPVKSSSGGAATKTPSPGNISAPAEPTPAHPAGITQALADAAEEKVRPRSAAPPPSRSRSPDRPKSAAAARETGWNPCFHHVVLGNKPLTSDPYGQLPPARPETSRPDGVPANLRPGTRQAARTAKFNVRRRRERKRKAAAETARMEADTRTWEASFAYPRSDAANRKAPRKQAPQTRPTTAPVQRPTADVAKRPATATSPASPPPGARPADAAKRPATAKSRLGASPAYLGRSPVRVAISPQKPQSTRIDPLARQLRTGEHLASKTYRARPAKPPRFGPKVHAAIAEELYKTI